MLLVLHARAHRIGDQGVQCLEAQHELAVGRGRRRPTGAANEGKEQRGQDDDDGHGEWPDHCPCADRCT